MTDLQNVRLGKYDKVHLSTRTPNYPYDIMTPAWPMCGLVLDNGSAKPHFVDEEVTCEACKDRWEWIQNNRATEQLKLGLG